MAFGGNNILCSANKSFSWTIPITSPPVTNDPGFNFEGLNDHSFFISKEGTSTPLGTYTLPDNSLITFKGLWIPSKIWLNKPGPNWTANGEPVFNTGSPTVKPEVSS